jgi:hypothetical protein
MSRPAATGVAIIVGVFTILGVLVALTKGGISVYTHLNEIHENAKASEARDLDIVLRLESNNRIATNHYEDALDGSNPDVSPEQAEEWLEDLEYDREQLKRMKMDYVEE